jgi:hypothetical protein
LRHAVAPARSNNAHLCLWVPAFQAVQKPPFGAGFCEAEIDSGAGWRT